MQIEWSMSMSLPIGAPSPNSAASSITTIPNTYAEPRTDARARLSRESCDVIYYLIELNTVPIVLSLSFASLAFGKNLWTCAAAAAPRS